MNTEVRAFNWTFLNETVSEMDKGTASSIWHAEETIGGSEHAILRQGALGSDSQHLFLLPNGMYIESTPSINFTVGVNERKIQEYGKQ